MVCLFRMLVNGRASEKDGKRDRLEEKNRAIVTLNIRLVFELGCHVHCFVVNCELGE